MNPDPDSPTLASCEAFQRRLSEAADAGAPLPPEIQAHIRSCAECVGFAELWYPNPPAALTRSIAVSHSDRLHERILEVMSRPEIVPFPVVAERRAGWITWSRRIAACLVVTGLAWWLLDPTHSPVGTPNNAATERTLAQSLAHTENRMKHEQQVLQTALVDGGQHVRGDVEWTLSALEL